jgi:hypothetical protein
MMPLATLRRGVEEVVGTTAALEHLEHVLGSATFQRSPAQARLLRYLCAKVLNGEQGDLKESTIAIEVFDRKSSFDQVSDSIVRVEAHRLRKRLEKYYETEGAADPLRIHLAVGAYVPQFLTAEESQECPACPASASNGNGHSTDSAAVLDDKPFPAGKALLLVLALVAIGALGYMILSDRGAEARRPVRAPVASLPSVGAAAGLVDSVRILAGYPNPVYVDRFGVEWLGDRFFNGGTVKKNSAPFARETLPVIRRAPDPGWFLYERAGNFQYDIPLKPGVYELRLHFAETTYGPSTIVGQGENSRTFNLVINGRLAAERFDPFVNAGDGHTATALVFRDIRPAPDGQLHLMFHTTMAAAAVNAIEITPGSEGKLLPIRMVAGDRPYLDSQGNRWETDRYVLNGRIAPHDLNVKETSDPGLYLHERYGHFSYEIPVAKGTRYTVRLHFAETYYGTSNPGTAGRGSRIFNVYCNGREVLHNYDILKAAGGENLARVETFRSIAPSPQGSIKLYFEPVVNYASVRALEIIDEGR